MRAAACLGWGAVSILLFSTVASAQAPQALRPFDLEQLTLNPSQRWGQLLGGGELLDARQAHAAFVLHYQHAPLVLLEDGAIVGAPVRGRLTAHLMAAYGITRWAEVGLQVPIVMYQASDSISHLVAPDKAGMGTPWLQGRFGILSQAKKHPIDLALVAALGIPLGSVSALANDQFVSFSPRVQVGRQVGAIRLAGEVGAVLRKAATLSPDAPSVADEIGSSLFLAGGVGTTVKGFRAELNLLGRVPFTRSPPALELLAGVSYPIGPVEVFVSFGPGFGRQPGTPAFRAMAGVGMSVPKGPCAPGAVHEPQDCPDLDFDSDGVLNGADRCPRDPGPVANAGCPARDSDGDGVPDETDACPTLKGSAAFSGCPDSDRDGVPDHQDRCPDQPGPKQNKGCPWGDSDGDGVIDPEDSCPDKVGVRDNKGCPWPDTDGDGLVDPDDSCPGEAGPAENKGCPWPDRDGDTVTDNLDNCPDEKGDPANQGCPKAKKQLVVITREKLVIKEKVFFDSGKAVIQARSFELLAQVAAVMNSHPDIKKVMVEGHTDSVGKADFNRSLSHRRAHAVRDFLIKKGVDGARLDAQGYGPDRPAADNGTSAGRELNRRVEFIVIHDGPDDAQIHEVKP